MAQAAYGSTHSLHSARLYEHAGQVLSAGMTCSAGATRHIQCKMPSCDMQARWDAQQAVGLLLTQLKVRGCLCCTAADCASSWEHVLRTQRWRCLLSGLLSF